MIVDTITLWFGEEFVIVESESVADKDFRAKGYVEAEKQIAEKEFETYQPELPKADVMPVKKKRGRPKKIKDSEKG